MQDTSRVLVGLGNNIGLVAVLALACSLLTPLRAAPRKREALLIGFLFGIVTLLGMRLPVVFSPGVYLDAKTILIPLACLYFGPWAGGTALVLAGSFRLFLGGVGTFPGIVILVTGAAYGLLFRRLRHRRMLPGGLPFLLFFGFVIAANAFLSTFLLPRALALQLLPQLWMPVFLVYPAGIVLLGSLLGAIESRNESVEAIKRGAEELRERNRFIETLLQITPDILYIYDLTESRTVFSNRGVEKILGLSEEGLKALGAEVLPSLMHPEDYREYLEKTRPRYADLGTEGSMEHQYRLRCADGSWRRFFSREVPYRIGADGKPFQIFGISRDITDLKAAEEKASIRQIQLLQADKMASLGILVAGMAHEINNPNNLVMFNADLLKTFFRDLLPVLDLHRRNQGPFPVAGIPYDTFRGEVGDLLQGLSEGAERIRAIVAGLKDFARVDAEGLDEEVDLNRVVDSALLITGNLLRESSADFAALLAPEPPRARGNAQQLAQVVINLLTNACHALTDRSQPLRIRTRAEAGEAIVEVEDGGRGISPEGKMRLFDPFYTTKRDAGGTGLGLSISYTIMQAHGGGIRLASEPGRGSRFTLFLPLLRRMP